jgi:protein gp37
MNKTGIEWATMTWNPLRGCSWASPGCDNCYAERIARRFSKGRIAPFHGVTSPETGRWNSNIEFIPAKLDEPKRIKQPQLIFAGSMSDWCHPNVLLHWMQQIFEVMRETPQHYYLVLTKRPYRIRRHLPEPYPANLAIGTSIEHPRSLLRGYKLLEQWSGACFLSLEPLLAEMSIAELLEFDTEQRIRQVIVGGETGPGARPMIPAWVRRLRDETKRYGRAFFFKQWGTGLFSREERLRLGRTLYGEEWNENPWPVPLANAKRHKSLAGTL